MKTKRILQVLPIMIGFIILVSFYSFNSGGEKSSMGQASSVGSLGEMGTCSRGGGALCHASSVGGLADNAGPGSVTLNSVPTLSGSHYIPGQLYHMTVTVSEVGKLRFGFACEILDNSGSTDGHINNTAGTVTITDVTNTRIWQAFGTGRLSVTHTSAGGFSSNTASFIFDWTAPSSGTVNVFLCGNATNNNAVADAADNVYLYRPVLTPVTTGIKDNNQTISLNVFPNPATDNINVAFNLNQSSVISMNLFSVDGKLIRTFENKVVGQGYFNQSYSTEGLSKGIYFLKVSSESFSESKKIFVN